jgi:small GTP-binding protein
LINRIAWSPDGRRIASPSYDGTIRIWDGEKGKLLKTLKGHEDIVCCVSWSPDGSMLASGSHDRTARLWDIETGNVLRKLKGDKERIWSVSWSPDGGRIASGADDKMVRLWDAETGKLLRSLKGHEQDVNSISWSPDGRLVASGADNNTVLLWDGESGEMLRILKGHSNSVWSVAWSPDGRMLASGGRDGTVRIWVAKTGRQLQVLEGHTDTVAGVSFSTDGELLASKSGDKTVRIWRTDTWETVVQLAESASGSWLQSLAFHPTGPILATLGEGDRVIRIWELDLEVLLDSEAAKEAARVSGHYRNAKVVLVGDTGVGKTGLSLVMTGKGYKETDSTHGRHVYTFEEKEEKVKKSLKETRETLLWDLAGQAGYRLVHQMHLNEVAVALVVFDARSETDPLAGVLYWDRAIRQALKRQRDAAIPLKKFLVAARTDRGGVAVSKERIKKVMGEMGFDGYFETSAKEGKKIKELMGEIRKAIDWDALPRVTSTELFHGIKQFILDEKEAGRLLCTGDELFRAFCKAHPDISDEELRSKFDTCVSRLQNRDLVRILSFGGYILLQPELLDAYASAIINAAKKEPEEMGSIAEEVALAGQFEMSKDARVGDKGQEELVLIPTVKELVDYDLGLREHSKDGTYLVFPSQFIRDWPEAPDPAGKAVVISFEGPVQNIYATLTVRLAHSGLFKTGRAEMWRNAVKFEAKAGGICGLYLREFSEGEGEFTLFYTKEASEQSRFEFEEYVMTHLGRRGIDKSVNIERLFVCEQCGTSVPGSYVEGRMKRGLDWIECGACGERVSLVYPKERLVEMYPSRIEEMDAAARTTRELNSAAMTLKGKIESNDFDVFLCHNSEDKAAVKKIGELLKDRGILPWLDEWEIQPGAEWQQVLEEQIKSVKSAAVFIGSSGMGPWQDQEQKAFLRQFVKRECRVIPVILPGSVKEPELPLFLEAFKWVDFRKIESDPLEELIWGITGERDGSHLGVKAVR